MTTIQAIILGIVQGLTEFLPVSSSGHLVILQNFMGISEGSLEFAIVLHLGTLLAVVIAYYESIWNMFKQFFLMLADLITLKGPCFEKSKYRKYIVYILMASIPAGIVGVLFEDFISEKFGSIIIVGFTLLITGVLLVLGDALGKNNRGHIENVGAGKAFLIGVFQMFAITPGISRSGSTIVGGLLSGLKKEEAVEFSFLMSIPAVLGSLLLKIKDIIAIGATTSFVPLIIGFFCSLVIGYFSIVLLNNIVKKGKLYYFSIYCWIVGLALIIYHVLITF
ncbi:undecaprenyl-diphosphatase UppP [Anaerofustis stercorihominis]|uniref:Undecaprenyl-diphosphatase n=2 Tax=Anaerofustis stercorihominis TaxID=214853 RepID=B1C6D3_9FIRM|nr:undecaprenyl-diphosphatase UppP [Anaerofustis stercorihominis]EDS73418.1 putative undecaprenyl-diphosphatase UppP [Anaerofustis stercorihominis DSM 17244]MCQ4794940.1 undecaprenyl-diphosphatase UppP [Anaerofustis stercorihominis]